MFIVQIDAGFGKGDADENLTSDVNGRIIREKTDNRACNDKTI